MRQLDLSRAHDPVAVEARLRRLERDREIHIHHLGMASRRITADYPELAGWFCLRVMTGREFSVEKSLFDAGVEAIVPQRKGQEIRKRGRIIPACTLPVIPGYVLVRCVPSAAAFVGLRHVPSVISVVGKGETPYRVPLKFVSRFIDLAVSGEYDYRHAETELKVGSKIHVIDGPFASFPAVVCGIDRACEGRIDVEVNIFGRPTPVELDLAQVQ